MVAAVAVMIILTSGYALAAPFCSPFTNCFRDSDCSGVGGFCRNRVCECGSDPGICSDRCPALPFCPLGATSCGGHSIARTGNTVHVRDCRGIATGGGGGVISYCNQPLPACTPPQGSSCLSAPNVCGMRNSGIITAACTCNAVTPPNSLCGTVPQGAFESVACIGGAVGWTFDADYSGPTGVDLYRDGAAGAGGTFVATVTANAPRPDVGALYPGRTNSGFVWSIPTALRDSTPHTLYTYARNLNSAGASGGANPLLAGSPRSFTCADPPVGTFVSADCTSANGTASDPQGSPVNVVIYNGIAGSGGVQIGSGKANPGFAIPISLPPITDGLPHTYDLHAYAADIPSGTQYEMLSPQTVTCIPPTPTPGPPPIVTIVKIDPPDYCQVGPEAIVTWQYTSPDGLAQTRWQMQAALASDPGFAAPIYDSGVQTGDIPAGSGLADRIYRILRSIRNLITSASAAGPLTSLKTVSTGQGVLSFGQAYWVRVQAWDSSGTSSGWSSPAASFATPAGPYPRASFTFAPPKPAAKQDVTFTDTTNYGGATPTAQQWDFGDGSAPDTTNPATHQYANPSAGITVTLRVSSSVMQPGQTCTATQNINVSKAIPVYKEVRPGAATSATPVP